MLHEWADPCSTIIVNTEVFSWTGERIRPKLFYTDTHCAANISHNTMEGNMLCYIQRGGSQVQRFLRSISPMFNLQMFILQSFLRDPYISFSGCWTFNQLSCFDDCKKKPTWHENWEVSEDKFASLQRSKTLCFSLSQLVWMKMRNKSWAWACIVCISWPELNKRLHNLEAECLHRIRTKISAKITYQL